jgi:hypothetical protein
MGHALLFADRLSVDVHRGSHIGVPQQFRPDLHIYAKLSEHRAANCWRRLVEAHQALDVLRCRWALAKLQLVH